MTIIGDNFIPGETAVVIGDTLIPPGDVTVAPDGDSLTFVVPVGTPIGAQTVRVITTGGTSAPGTFTVTGPAAPVSTNGALPYTGVGQCAPAARRHLPGPAGARPLDDLDRRSDPDRPGRPGRPPTLTLATTPRRT